MHVYRLTKEGRRVAKVPGPNRTEVLDHLYNNKTCSLDELLAIDKDAKWKLRELQRAGYVEEVTSGIS